MSYSACHTIAFGLAWTVGLAGQACSGDGSTSSQNDPLPSNRPAGNQGESVAGKANQIIPLNKSSTVRLDRAGRRLLLQTRVVFREGPLEMLCCLKQTKEHESILAVDAKAHVIHAGLLALGAEKGRPVRFVPKFQPPTGQRIDVSLLWVDAKGKQQRAVAQTWIRHAIHRFYSAPLNRLPPGLVILKKSELRFDKKNQELSWYGPMTLSQRDELLALTVDEPFQKAINDFFARSRPREMKAHWVFAGSGFTTDKQTGESFYHAEDGDLICVANFPTAALDIAVESSATGQDLLYEAYTERIPPLGTEVTIELSPVFKKRENRTKTPRRE